MAVVVSSPNGRIVGWYHVSLDPYGDLLPFISTAHDLGQLIRQVSHIPILLGDIARESGVPSMFYAQACLSNP
jgi:hypothetical protein